VLQNITAQGCKVQELQGLGCDVALLHDTEAVDAPRYRGSLIMRRTVKLNV
jgi:hypothetical protein